jgi:hypothetical protein
MYHLTGMAVQLTVIRQVSLDHPPSVVFGQSYPDGYRMGTKTAIVRLCTVDSVHLGSKILKQATTELCTLL